MNLVELAKQWTDGAKIIKEWLGDGAVTVSHQLAQQRANVCLRCPMNVHEYDFTEAVAAVIRRQVELKNKLQLRLVGEKSLHTCSGCGCVLRLKCWLPIERLGLDAAELEKFDPACWMRKEFKP